MTKATGTAANTADLMPPLTQEKLKRLVSYDPDTGVFTSKVRRGPLKPGKRAGTITGPYRWMNIGGVKYSEHRLAFLYMTGVFPPEEVDHTNQDSLDNRWSNLKPASPSQNQRNVRLQKNNSSGVCGVHWAAKSGKWAAKIYHRKPMSLGYFDDFQEAVVARRKAEKRLGFHPNHGRSAKRLREIAEGREER